MSLNPSLVLKHIDFSEIPGWQDDDHALALAAFKRSYEEIKSAARGFKRDVMFGGKLDDWLVLSNANFETNDARQIGRAHV